MSNWVKDFDGGIVDGNSSNWNNHATKRRGVEWAYVNNIISFGKGPYNDAGGDVRIYPKIAKHFNFEINFEPDNPDTGG